MKAYFMVFLIVFISGCKSKMPREILSQISEKQTFKLKKCSDNANCTITLIPKTSFLFKKDEFGQGYLQMIPGEYTVLIYEFRRKELQNSADSNYSELLYIEIPNSDNKLLLKDETLKEVKMTYARLCFCKGASGYFQVKKGNLELTLEKNALTLKTNFKVEKLPQIITEVDEKIRLNK